MRLINLTPHDINFFLNDDSITNIIIHSSGIARCDEVVNKGLPFFDEDLGTIPIITKNYGNVTGLPDRQEGVYYIVSILVAQACPNRNDLFIIGESVRNEKGQIIGCRSLATL